MGRQIAIAMESEDEEAFLAFLRESGEIAIYRSWSPSPAPVMSFVQGFAASPFWVHNLAFKWKPQFERVEYQDQTTGRQGTYFRLQTRHAPLLEYSRHPMAAPSPEVAGRLYWSKLFLSQPNEIAYDLSTFDTWFTSIARWVRKHGKRLSHGATEPWCLPVARARLQNGL